MAKNGLPKYVYKKGRKSYLYFVRPGICERIHSKPGTPEFAAEYAMLLKGRTVTPTRTIAKLIDSYRASQKWAKLAHNTRRSYERSLEYFRDAAGKIDPAKLRRVHVNQMRDALAEKPTDANRKIGALSVLMEHAIDIGWLDQNPVKGVRRLEATGKKREPWPLDMIEAFRAEAPPRTLLLFEMLLGTGQRIGDVLTMKWEDCDGNGFTLTQGKTKRLLYVPLTDRLKATLGAAPRLGPYVVSQDNGHRLSYQLAHKDMMVVRKAIGAEAYDIHGLRYSAASEIASIPGMTVEHVQAITGHSGAAMAHLYAGPAIQRARATEAQSARGANRDQKGNVETPVETDHNSL